MCKQNKRQLSFTPSLSFIPNDSPTKPLPFLTLEPPRPRQRQQLGTIKVFLHLTGSYRTCCHILRRFRKSKKFLDGLDEPGAPHSPGRRSQG